MQSLPSALAALAQWPQFILYRTQPSSNRPGKTDKITTAPGRGDVNAHDAANWLTADAAIAGAAAHGLGVGFVLTANDPFWFIDIDDCAQDGAWSPIAQDMLRTFAGAAVEVSQSGRGLHVIGSARAVPEHAKRNGLLHLECYTELRFIALTGTAAGGDAGSDHTAALADVVARYFPPKEGGGDWEDLPDAPRADWRGPADDAQLLQRAMRSQSAKAAFGGGASFADLWEARVDKLATAYPDAERAYDASSADRALAQHLAFWTGCDGKRIERLMRGSKLARDKWERDDYLPRTIASACASQRDVLTDAVPEAPQGPAPVEGSPAPTPVVGNVWLNVEGQVELFQGCVYVVGQHRVLVPGGHLVKPEVFRTMYSGRNFVMDGGNERMSRNAWEAFTESQLLRAPRADTVCFKPALPPASIINEGGRSMVNVWWPVDVPRAVGDPAPFLQHLARVLPDERDREILLSYMAACVQYKGVKFQWAPLLQGVEGNGKTLFTRCVAEAVGRRYVHWPKASKITNQFNGWMERTVFIAVEDVYVPDSRREVLEELKPMITGDDGLEIERKGQDQFSADVCCNFMLNCNPIDGLRKTRNDRRFAPFFTAQQQTAHLRRDKMDGDYFPRLYKWLREQGGYAVVSELLHTYPIDPALNPANGHKAPLTSSTEQAIAIGLGSIEQEVLEAISRGDVGFMGGWISSTYLDRLLDRLGAAGRIPLNKRRPLLQELGYDWHPGLHDGRVNNIVMPDAQKPRLYVQPTHPQFAMSGAADIARAYSAAQGVSHPTANR